MQNLNQKLPILSLQTILLRDFIYWRRERVDNLSPKAPPRMKKRMYEFEIKELCKSYNSKYGLWDENNNKAIYEEIVKMWIDAIKDAKK